jgi:hypothetical protein
MVVGVVVLLIAAIAFANRGQGVSGSGSGSGSDEKKPHQATTAASGDQPVTSQKGGIPAGFSHDERGAQSAAANYAVALGSADIVKPGLRDGIVRQIFAPDQVATSEDKLNAAYSKDFLAKVGLDAQGNAPAGLTYVSRTLPVGTNVIKATKNADAVTVDVWCTGVFGTAGDDSTNPVSTDWFTMTLSLRWADGDWKIESFSQKDGPTPVSGDNQISPSDDIAKAVKDYGGFTYAR